MQLSLWHPKSCTHRVYGMTCEQFEQLRRRAGDLCEMCGSDYHPLSIDHDHNAHTGFPPGAYEYATGWIGVRGLICPKCNSHMRFVDNGTRPVDERTSRYLAQAWHLTNVPAETFPAPDPEPPLRSVVRGPRRRMWRRAKAGWVAIQWPKNHVTEYGPRTWLYLSYAYGPKNLTVIR